MDPTILLIAVAALACPIGMGAMMWMMMRQGGRQQMGMGSTPPPREQSLAAMQAQKAALEKEIRELETVQALEQRRDSLKGETMMQKEKVQA